MAKAVKKTILADKIRPLSKLEKDILGFQEEKSFFFIPENILDKWTKKIKIFKYHGGGGTMYRRFGIDVGNIYRGLIHEGYFYLHPNISCVEGKPVFFYSLRLNANFFNISIRN